MKRLNGQPIVQMLMAVQYAMPLAEAEAIIAKRTQADQLSALREWMLNHPCDDPMIFEGLHDSSWTTFYQGYGKALADKRAQELKMLVAPAPAPHPEDVENL